MVFVIHCIRHKRMKIIHGRSYCVVSFNMGWQGHRSHSMLWIELAGH